MHTIDRRTAGAWARAVLLLCLLVGTVLVAKAMLPPPAAPLPDHTFDARGHAAPSSTPSAAAGLDRPSASVLTPARITIPSLGVDAALRHQTVDGAGDLVVPGDPAVVGWWHGAASTGTVPARGTLVLAGHVDSNGDLGALHPLARIAPHAEVLLSDGAGKVQRWRVDALEVRHKDDLPTLASTGARRLAIVTCGGPVVDTPSGRSYRDNVVVWASPAA